eukprot:TRINITY_DN1116_c0_g1_i3.p1 TRINITY_DN1116_c0_g1~~TRINITY_DN1116_c0_g1_i3.p1  ORF type:complete len:718 (+),score=101.27 TRINITY_DN1116_c0_g1_i3:67-2220(+)
MRRGRRRPSFFDTFVIALLAFPRLLHLARGADDLASTQNEAPEAGGHSCVDADCHGENEDVTILEEAGPRKSGLQAGVRFVTAPLRAAISVLEATGEAALEGLENPLELGIDGLVEGQGGHHTRFESEEAKAAEDMDHGSLGEEDGRTHKRRQHQGDAHDEADEGSVFLDGTLNLLQGRVRKVADAVRATGDTFAGLTGSGIKTVGATVQGVASMLDSTSSSLSSRQKEEQRLPAWMLDDADSTAQEKEAPNSNLATPFKSLAGLGRNTLADAFKVGGTALKGVGDAVFQVGAVAESVTSGTGQVAEDVVRVFDGVLGFARSAVDPRLDPEARKSTMPATLNSNMADIAAKDLTSVESGYPQISEPAPTSVWGRLWHGLAMAFRAVTWLAALTLHKFHVLITGDSSSGAGFVPSLGPHLAVALMATATVVRRPWKKRRRTAAMVIIWLVTANVDLRHRRRLMWAGETAAERRLDGLRAAGGESTAWINTMLQLMWRPPADPGVAGKLKDQVVPKPTGLSAYVARQIGAEAYKALSATAPKSVAQIEISELNLGTVPPRLRGITLISPDEAPVPSIAGRPAYNIALDFEINTADMDIVVVVKMSKLERAKLPTGNIRLSALRFRARLLASIEMVPSFPFVGIAVVSFADVPDIDLHVSLGSGLDVMSLGSADSWVRHALQASLRAYVKPRFMEIELGPSSAAAAVAPPAAAPAAHAKS